MKLSHIVAMDRKGVIGRDGDLPWRLPSDLKRFKQITMGKPIVMGRYTHESIGRPLPGRDNVVISRNSDYMARGCTVLHSLECVYAKYHDADEIMIMGGEELYRQTLDRADRIYLTEIHAELEGDTWYPDFDRDAWEEVERRDFRKDDRNEYDYSFVVMDRRYS